MITALARALGQLSDPPFRRVIFKTFLWSVALSVALFLAAAWGVTVAVVRLAMPDWGISWLGLPLGNGWGPFLGCTCVMFLLYVLAVAGLRVVRGKDLELLKELTGR